MPHSSAPQHCVVSVHGSVAGKHIGPSLVDSSPPLESSTLLVVVVIGRGSLSLPPSLSCCAPPLLSLGTPVLSSPGCHADVVPVPFDPPHAEAHTKPIAIRRIAAASCPRQQSTLFDAFHSAVRAT